MPENPFESNGPFLRNQINSNQLVKWSQSNHESECTIY